MSTDINRRVAEAIEVPVVMQGDVCTIGFNYQTANGVAGGEREFDPAHDLNDAWWAAEKFQASDSLFGALASVTLHKKTDGYQALLPYGMYNHYGEGETPAAALCAAILARGKG